MEKLKKNAFTLIELMVAITLIAIIAIWSSNLNFNALSDRQKLDGFFYKIKTNIETVMNNALIGKAIKLSDDSIIVPKQWKINFNNSWSWIIQSQYLTWWLFISHNEIIPDRFYSITTNCEDFSWNNTWSLDNATWSILIEWTNLSYTWSTAGCSWKNVFRIETKYKNFKKIFTINTISWVIEEK